MSTAWHLERPRNSADRLLSYAPGTPERLQLLTELKRLQGPAEELPLVIEGKPVTTGQFFEVHTPHDHRRVLAKAHLAGERELAAAIESALKAQAEWAALDGYGRAAVFLRAADLLEGPRRIQHIAAIMANHSKTPFEAEIDLAELVDFWRFNAYFLNFLYEQQPEHGPTAEYNRFDWRPLEGFVLAVPPFNFYAIAGNLPTAPALCGNVALWKPARATLLSNYRIMQLLLEAGLPPGVLNFVPFESRRSEAVLAHPALAGLHFTGNIDTFSQLWQGVAKQLNGYRSFPRVVGETGGKDFIVVHPSAEVEAVVANVLRGAFEYQGQKCSAASRLYAPKSLWPQLRERLVAQLPALKVGPVEELTNALGAVITEEAFLKIGGYLDLAGEETAIYTIVAGGGRRGQDGWFIEPTLIESRDPRSRLMSEEIFGPVLTVYVYPDGEYEDTLRLCEQTSPYALTGSIFAQERQAIVQAERILRFAAGNFYINDKPTGAVVGRQPFGGARRSGTNDKAGSWLNLTRWMSPRNIKETTLPARAWQRPYLG